MTGPGKKRFMVKARIKQWPAALVADVLLLYLTGSINITMFVGCLTSQQQASVSQGRICSDNFTCCHTEIEVADPTFYLTQSQYIDTGPTSPSADPISPGAWQGSHWECQCLSHWYDSTSKKSRRKRDSNPRSSALEADALPLGQRGGNHYKHVLHRKRET